MRQAANYHTEYSFSLVKIRANQLYKRKQIRCRELDMIDIKGNSPRGGVTEGAMSRTDQRLLYSELDQIFSLVGK
jgi:hypothetical protein